MDMSTPRTLPCKLGTFTSGAIGPGMDRDPERFLPALEREIAAVGAHGGRKMARIPCAHHCLTCGGPCQSTEHEVAA